MEDIERITRDNQNRIRYNNNEILQSGLERYSNCVERSVIRSEVRKNGSRKKVINDIRRRIIAIALAGTALASAYAALKDNNVEIKNPIIGISNTIKHNKDIDEKILDYQNMMNSSGEFAIETVTSSMPLPGQKSLPVDYKEENYKNLVTVMQNSANISEEEFRCAVLGAYKVINAPYREEVLDQGFKRASFYQGVPVFNIPSSLDEYLETLGYDSLEDYNNNERDNIKNITQIEIKNEGRGM